MSGKHTPGPWRINENSSDCGDDKLSIETADDYFIAQVDGGVSQRANAVLIAAAPDLLAALQGMLAAWNMFCDASGWERDHIPAQVDATEAIAKATGAA